MASASICGRLCVGITTDTSITLPPTARMTNRKRPLIESVEQKVKFLTHIVLKLKAAQCNIPSPPSPPNTPRSSPPCGSTPTRGHEPAACAAAVLALSERHRDE